MMIHIHCRTNLDEGKGKKWPIQMAFPPRVGDYVEAEDGYKLKIVSITHSTQKNPIAYLAPVPLVIVELNKSTTSCLL